MLLGPGQRACDVPLFRRGRGVEPIRTNAILQITRQLMSAIGENPAQFGTHSYRIGGASAVYAAIVALTFHIREPG